MVNVYALDQEGLSLVWTNDGKQQHKLDVDKFLANLEPGGGFIVGDGNAWGVRNPRSASQFGWQKPEDLDDFLDYIRSEGYKAITIPNKLANTLQFRYGMEAPDAVFGLFWDVTEQVATTGRYDSGHPVRASRYPGNDNSFGERANVVLDFLKVQNFGGYESPFIEDVIQIAFDALPKNDRELFDLKKTMPKVNSPRRIAAVACCVYDPKTGQLRTHNGKPWGINFIVRRIIGLNGMMTGKGVRAPGNPMRAALRCVGRRYGEKVNRDERARFDKLVRDLVKAFQAHGPVRHV